MTLPDDAERVRLVDASDDAARTTASLVASLSARLATLHFITGATAIGSLTAGFAALGREVAGTAEGARLREAIERGRAGANGDLLWSTLIIGPWASGHAPSPILDQLRNDVALLLADDLAEVLAQPPMPNPAAGAQGTARADAEAQPVEFADYLLGMWAYAREVVRSVEALAAPTQASRVDVAATDTTTNDEPGPDGQSSLLR